jgi:hypothetical protein
MQTRMWKPLRGEIKIYGMPVLGVILAIVGVFVAMTLFSLMFSVIGSLPGYYLGDYLSKILHDGKAQRFIHWYFPSKPKASIPDSAIKYFY